jgi:hypothetical protein
MLADEDFGHCHGGNSLIRDAGHMSVPDQYAAVVETARHIMDLLERGFRIVVTHGNGPQVGFILLRSEHSRGLLHQVPLDSIVADTQGALGYQIQQALENEFRRRGLRKSVATVITQTLVDRADPAFARPSKPIGQFYSRAEAEERMRVEKWDMVGFSCHLTGAAGLSMMPGKGVSMKPFYWRIGIAVLVASNFSAWAQVPPLLSYQGRIAVTGTNFTGSGQFKFALVNAAGTLTYWSNDGTSSGGGAPTNAVTVPVTNGLFGVMLGDTNLAHMTAGVPPNIFTNPDVRLRLWFNDGISGFQQLAPDQRLGSVGYAMQSATAALALGVAPGVAGTGTVVQVNTGAGLTGGPITTSGTVGIPSGGVSNAMLQNSTLTVMAGSGLTGGGTVPLGGSTSLALNLTNPNTWTATQTFSNTIVGSISGTASGFTGPLAGDVTGTQSATLITNLSASKIAGLLRWQSVAGTSVQAQPNTGYILTNSTQVMITLPTNANTGDTFRLAAPGAGGWKLSQNAAQSVLAGNFGTLDIGLSWIAVGPSANWKALASSADGTKLVAAVNGGQIYTSTDSGTTWSPHGPSTNWSAVASSADGTKLVATANGAQIYTSTDLGVTWTPRDSTRAWSAVASSGDGLRLVAAVNGGNLYTSTDSGGTWTARDSSRSWVAVASSADGTMLAAAVSGSFIYTSTNSGVTWISHLPGNSWSCLASSADGTGLAAGNNSGQIYTSRDAGTTWTPRASGSRSWLAIASSGDGMKLVAVANNSQIYVSTDFGVSWTGHDNTRTWQCVAGSSECDKLAAGVNGGQIYVSEAPSLTSTTTTTPGTSGYLTGGQGTALELQYLGNNQFFPLSHEGPIFAY